MPIELADLQWAVGALGERLDSYSKARKYYVGDHDLGFATAKFQSAFGNLFKQLAYNRCAPVVDSVTNRLRVTGFSVSGPIDVGALTIPDANDPASEVYSQQAMALWRLGEMHLREGELYAESATTGDAYGVVYWDAPAPLGTGLPRIWPNKAETVRVRYDDEGRKTLAVKGWLITSGPDKNKRRLTFYTPTTIERYISTGTAESEFPKELEQYTLVREVNALGQQVINPVVHNLGRVPVVHYPNNAPMLGDYGISELRDVMPLQDALNKALADMLVAMEYNAFQQRWITGIDEPELDENGRRRLPFKTGPGEIWFSTDKEAKFGSFDTSNLEQYLKVQDQLDLDIARVSAIPVHWLVMTGTPPSGESLKTADAPFSAKLRDRQRSHGSGHAEAMSLKFQLLGVKEPLLITPEWESAEPRSEREQAEIGQMMANAGIPLDIVARVMGLPADEVQLIAERELERQAQAEASREQALAQLAGQQMTSQLESDSGQT